ncbi:MAG: DUF2341 domain-containing protein, partial [Conexivisphaerales archaeon]
MAESGVVLPAGILHAIPITITNIGNLTTSYFQQIVEINSSIYASWEAQNLQNIEFFYSNGTIIPSWLESGNSKLSQQTIYWLKINVNPPAPSALTVYMGFGSLSTNYFNGITVGEAPELTQPYGLYDNGKEVFDLYDNFKGSTLNQSVWLENLSRGSYLVNNGLNINFNGIGYVVTKKTFGVNTVFQAYVTSTGDVNNIGFFNTTQEFPGGYSGEFIREACGYTYPDQWNSSGEANGCGNNFGYFLNSEGKSGVYSVQIVSKSSSYQRYDGLLYGTTQPIDTYYPNLPLQAGFDGVYSSIGVQWARILTPPPFGSSVLINGSPQPQNIYEPGITEAKLIIHINYPSYLDINNNLVASGVTYFATNVTYGMNSIAVINPYHNPFSEEVNVVNPVQTVWVNLTNSSGVVGNYYPWVPIGPYGYLNPSEALINGSLTQITQNASGHIGPIAIDYSNPNIIYIASGNGPSYSGPLADGGIFKTVDDGINWQPVDYGLPYSRTSALFMDQQNPNILVAGMLQMGIYRTTDGGGYWYKVSDYSYVTDIFEVNGTL